MLNLTEMIDPSQIRLGNLREDVQLQAAARGQDGAPHWNLFDPVRNRFFRIGWLEFELLTRWQQGMQVGQLCHQVAQECVLQPQVDDVLSLLQFLQQSELLQASSPQQRQQLQAAAKLKQQSVWKWFLHNYLFFRIPLITPDHFLSRSIGYLQRVFQAQFFYFVGALALLGMLRVLDQWSAFTSTFLYFFSWQGLALYGFALVLTKLIHEFAHAYTAKHYGLRVPTMGVAFMLLWPLLYTDTSEGWKLTSRRARLAIGGAGVIAELLLAGVAALAWSVLPDGALKSAAYILAAVTWISTLAINLNPFMRFDGYYLLMDFIDMPNLHERSFAFGRWQLRRWILGADLPIPESEHEARRHWLIAYAYLTWLYRLVLFTGIAATVYYFFFKIAGVILFAVEIGWFVVRPVWKESHSWWQLKTHWRPRRVLLSLSVLLILLILLALPWASQISAPGFAQAEQHTRLYPHMSAQVQEIFVKEGQQVKKDQLLLQLQSPELEWQSRALQARLAGLQEQVERAVGNPALLERLPLWQQEMAAAQSMLQALQDERNLLALRAPHAGVVRDLDPGIYPGAWLAKQRIVARVVDGQQLMAQVYVAETEVARIKPGASAKVFLRRADGQKIAATVISIDRTATHVLPQPMLASVHGGPLAARTGKQGELLANDGLYRVNLRLETEGEVLPEELFAVQADIQGEHASTLMQGLRRVAGVLIRESGF